MKKTALLLPLLVAGMLSCNNTPTENTTPPKADSTPAAPVAEAPKPAPPPMDSAAMMKKMQDYATPGEMHKMLASANGNWDADVTAWMDPDPSKPPVKSKGSATNKMVMNGLYQMSSFKGNMMGMPFEGSATTGYDNIRKVFVCTWIDNMGSGIMYMEGTMDAASKTITFKGKMTDCMSDGQADVRQTMTFTDDKHQRMEMFYIGADGKEAKTMEIAYTKK